MVVQVEVHFKTMMTEVRVVGISCCNENVFPSIFLGGFSRGGSYRGASRGNNGSSNYAPY